MNLGGILADFIPISALSEYAYCPVNCYLTYMQGERRENPYTVEGKILHSRVQERAKTRRAGAVQFRRVYVYSNCYQISGFADLVEEKSSQIYPVEHKRGKGSWRSDHLQLCAQALCLEEMFGIEVLSGYIFYAASGRREKVIFDKELRAYTVEVIRKVRSLFEGKFKPEPIYSNKCKGCSLKPICLPKETTKLKATRISWE
jgi:CRISPR-associated exonuclease Cas4